MSTGGTASRAPARWGDPAALHPRRPRKFAEICAATVLAGELSIIGSLAAGDFARAHQEHGRKGAKSP